MATVERTVTVTQPLSKVWNYLSDFRTTEEWDPPTVSTVRTGGEGGVGTTYHNVSRFLGHDQDVYYTVSEYVEGQRFQLTGEAGDSLKLIDTMTFTTDQGQTSVTYHAEFIPAGAAKLAQPLLPLGLKVLADRVAGSLKEKLEAL